MLVWKLYTSSRDTVRRSVKNKQGELSSVIEIFVCHWRLKLATTFETDQERDPTHK